jgi:3-mercaptopyruvate sulfurtransferase SseA
LIDKGYKKVFALKGGWNAWLEQNGPVEPKTQPKTDPNSDPKPDPKKPGDDHFVE